MSEWPAAGKMPRSLRAIVLIIRKLAQQIFTVPTLIRRLHAPTRTLIADLPDTERVLIGLDLCTS